MVEPPPDLLKEILRLERENNQLLHGMRRRAFLWGILRFLLYAGLILGPLWFYMAYLSGTLDTLVNEINKVQGVNVNAQQKFGGFESAFKRLRSRFPDFLQLQGSDVAVP